MQGQKKTTERMHALSLLFFLKRNVITHMSVDQLIDVAKVYVQKNAVNMVDIFN